MKNYNGIKIQQLNDESWPIAAAEVVKPLFRIWKTMQGKCGRGNLGVAPAWESFRRFYEWASLEAPYTEEMELLFGSPEKDFFNTPSWRLKAKMSSNPASEIKEAGAFFVTKRLMEELMDVWVILSMVARGEDPYGEKPDFPAMLRMVNGNLARLQVEYDPAHATGLKAHLAKLVGLLEKNLGRIFIDAHVQDGAGSQGRMVGMALKDKQAKQQEKQAHTGLCYPKPRDCKSKNSGLCLLV